MKLSIAKKWIAALRSGNYKQAKETLRRGNSFCCLGVLCNLHAQEHPEIAAEQRYAAKYMGRGNFLPEAVAVWAGLKSDNAMIPGHLYSLSYQNDTGADFKKIADLIAEFREVL